MAVSTEQKRAQFRSLHQSGCFVLPNPWDAGTAKMLAGMGYKALASTSSGFAWSNGKPDSAVSCEDVLAHLTALCAATDLPVNADFEAGYSGTAQGVGANVRRAVATGVAGVSIEDATGDPAAPLFDVDVAVERIRAARAAIDATGENVMLIGRCEGFLLGETDIGKVIARLAAYSEAGADCLYPPGVKTREHIELVVKALAPKPVNILMGAPGMSVSELAALGVRRISVGGAMARTAWTAFLRASKDIIENGSFAQFGHAISYAELNGMFAAMAKEEPRP
ncbi:MAG: isocitrate lyase/phosphoenolpyruvate mutase family protein [Bradyrhizobiaceae bacterium]|nr:MAG: isocitrate lyase/phosphoenolpyruvate mutase family protein [Bradyrhizobiaceae bacterium]